MLYTECFPHPLINHRRWWAEWTGLTHVLPHLVGHGVGHHDAADDDDQDEVERVHEAGAPGLADLGATAVGAAGVPTAAGQLEREHRASSQSLSFIDLLSPDLCRWAPTHRTCVNKAVARTGLTLSLINMVRLRRCPVAKQKRRPSPEALWSLRQKQSGKSTRSQELEELREVGRMGKLRSWAQERDVSKSIAKERTAWYGGGWGGGRRRGRITTNRKHKRHRRLSEIHTGRVGLRLMSGQDWALSVNATGHNLTWEY